MEFVINFSDIFLGIQTHINIRGDLSILHIKTMETQSPTF